VGTLVVASPFAREFPASQSRDILAWVGRGSTLVLFLSGQPLGGFYETQILSELGVDLEQTPREFDAMTAVFTNLETKAVEKVFTFEETRGAETLALERYAGALRGTGQRVVLPLYTDGEDAFVVIVPHGKGRVIISSSGAPLANALIRKEDNLRFALNIASAAAKGGIYFDEYHHGYKDVFGARDIFKTPGGIALLVLGGILVILFLFSRGRRFGPARPPVRYSRRSALEFVHSAGDLYRRGDCRSWAAEVLWRGFMRRMTRAGALTEVRDKWGRVTLRGTAGGEAERIVKRLHGPDDLAALIREMDRLEEIAQGR
jgi:hypothetical protein